MDAGNPAEFVKTVFSRKFFERILLNIVIYSRLNLFENLTYGKIQDTPVITATVQIRQMIIRFKCCYIILSIISAKLVRNVKTYRMENINLHNYNSDEKIMELSKLNKRLNNNYCPSLRKTQGYDFTLKKKEKFIVNMKLMYDVVLVLLLLI